VADKVVTTNRRALHDYTIVATLEAGLVLTGSEIKSVRASRVSLQEAYVAIEGGEAWLTNAHIASYPMAGYADHEPLRRRKLLLHKKEIRQLAFDIQAKGMALIPLKLYLHDGRAKIELGLARGKRQYDKREAIRQRDTQRDLERQLSQRQRR
jgi:SsrA-binding protein